MTSAKDPLRYFRVEANEISEELGRGALQAEREVTPELIARLMRLAHTLKGAASVVRQRAIADRTHQLEDALAELRHISGAAPRDNLDTILTHVDAIAREVASLPAPPGPTADAAETPLDQAAVSLPADITELDALLDGISEAGVLVRGLHRTTALVEEGRHLASLLATRAASPPWRRQSGQEIPAFEQIRHFADDLQYLLARIEQQLRTGIDQSERELQQAHAAAERLRLVPCNAAFASLERAVRDTAQASGKRAVLEVAGGDVRLDGHVLGLVQRALVQLLRNAIAHGIEPPAERVAAGKPETGRIEIQVARRGDRIAFTCRDDGVGVDREAVERAAAARGSFASGAGGTDSDKLLDLLLEGGLSTSRGVTELAGRGVGLDIVREVAARLGGKLAAQSERGSGTCIELVVPVTLSSLEALLVEICGVIAAIPLDAIRHVARLPPDNVTRTAEGESILYDGKTIPLLTVAVMKAAAGTAAATPGSRSAVVVGADSTATALAVDRLLGVENLVVRPVPPLACADPIVAGLWLDREGVPRPVLDSEAVVKVASSVTGIWEAPLVKRPKPILVIDDSLTTRVLEQSILESAGYEVDLATSAEEALEKVRDRFYGLFLVDVEMPGMDGFTFVERMRADPKLREVPAILVTSRATPEDRQRGADAGANAYIVKSEFDQRKVLETIRGLLD